MADSDGKDDMQKYTAVSEEEGLPAPVVSPVKNTILSEAEKRENAMLFSTFSEKNLLKLKEIYCPSELDSPFSVCFVDQKKPSSVPASSSSKAAANPELLALFAKTMKSFPLDPTQKALESFSLSLFLDPVLSDLEENALSGCSYVQAFLSLSCLSHFLPPSLFSSPKDMLVIQETLKALQKAGRNAFLLEKLADAKLRDFALLLTLQKLREELSSLPEGGSTFWPLQVTDDNLTIQTCFVLVWERPKKDEKEASENEKGFPCLNLTILNGNHNGLFFFLSLFLFFF